MGVGRLCQGGRNLFERGRAACRVAELRVCFEYAPQRILFSATVCVSETVWMKFCLKKFQKYRHVSRGGQGAWPPPPPRN